MPYVATKRATVFRTARERSAPGGRVETDVISRRVSCTHARSWRFSRSETHSWGDRVFCLSTNSMGFVGLTLCLAFLAPWGRGCQPRGYREFWHRFRSLGLLPTVGHFCLFEGFHGRFKCHLV